MAEDFPHGKGSWISDMSSIRRGMWERKLWMAKEAEKAKQDEGKWPGEPGTSPFFSFYFTTTGAPVAMAQIYRIERR